MQLWRRRLREQPFRTDRLEAQTLCRSAARRSPTGPPTEACSARRAADATPVHRNLMSAAATTVSIVAATCHVHKGRQFAHGAAALMRRVREEQRGSCGTRG